MIFPIKFGINRSIERSRTEYSARNTSVALVAKVIAILAGFITRIVFTNTFSQDYVGVNSLFSDILRALAFSDLGIDTAVTYALYRPIAEGDIEKQKTLMKMFRNLCRIAAFLVFGIGISIIPFIIRLIKYQNGIDRLILIYLLYLMNSVMSYFMVYKKILIEAHQLSYICVLYQTGSLILQDILQIIVLLYTKNFLLFVSVMSLCTFLNNFFISKKADSIYPYLKDKQVSALSKMEKKGIYQNIRAMLWHKLGKVFVNNTDNLLLSSIVGIISNSQYSNYYLIIGSITQILEQFFHGIIASVGNLGVKEELKHVQKVFETSFFVGQWIFGLCTICIFETINIFIEICFGDNYVFQSNITLILCLNFYFTGMRQAVLVFRDSMGIFWYDRYKSLLEAIVNLLVSIFLGIQLGVSGIFWGTLVSIGTTSFWIEPYVLYKYCMKSSCKSYFLRYGVYTFVTVILWYGEDLVCRKITGDLWAICIKRGLFCILITNLCYLLFYHKTKEFKLLFEKMRMILK